MIWGSVNLPPVCLQALMNSNPQMRAMADSSPEVRAMLSNPDAMRQILNPETMQAMINMQRVRLTHASASASVF